jgi:predicted alpha/beta-fold hydrolase
LGAGTAQRADSVRDQNKARLWLSDFRKFAEQYGDIIGWDATNRKYVLAHGMTGVDWEHYKHPLPEHVYDVYIKSWKKVVFTRETKKGQAPVVGA